MVIVTMTENYFVIYKITRLNLMHGRIFLYDKLQRYFSLPVKWFRKITRDLYLSNIINLLYCGELCRFFAGCNSRSTDVC